MLQNKIFRISVLTTTLPLVACGGGGDGGYFGNTPSTPSTGGTTGSTTTPTKEAVGISLTLSKDQLSVKGDELTVTAKAVDKDGGGVANKKVVLNIKDALTLGATSDASEKTTNEKGEVTFTVKLTGTNPAAQELMLTTTLAGTTINNVRKVSISGTGTVVQSQYELKFDAIKSLKVSGGETIVRVRAVDTNGGGVPNQDVALAIKNFSTQSDVSIKGLSTAKTDNEGYATFTIQLATGTEVSRAALIQSGVGLVATLTEASGATKTQVSTIGVSSVANLVSSLAVTTSNNNKVEAADGSISVVVNAKNPDGLPVANQTVSLQLDEQALQYGAKLVSSTAKTDANGNATFIVQTQTNSLNPTGQLLVQNGIVATAKLEAADGNTISAQTTKITVVSVISDEVSYLTVNTPDRIEISGGQAVVTVTAVDKNGGVLSDKSVNLAVKNSAQNGITIKEGSQQTTKEGKATFTLQFNPAGISAATLANLLSNGVDIGVGYAKAIGGTVTQTTRVQFYTKQAANPAVDRLEMAISKGVVNASNDTVEVKVRAIDEKGNAAANQPVKFEFTKDAAKTSVRFDGASTKNTDGNGYVSYTLHTTAANSEAIDKLIKEGITIQTTSGTTTQTIQVMVQAAAAETVAVSYLSVTADSMININKGQAKVTVKAVDSNGGVLAGRAITLKIADSQKNGLTIDSSKIVTDAQGNATFTVSYNGSITDQTVLNQLKGEGVLLTAEYQPANGLASVTQTTRLRYYQQNINADVQQLAINLSKGVAVASNDAMTVTVKAVDEYGQPVMGRKISLGLNDVAKNNGVSFTTGSSVVTDATGEAKFSIKLAAPNSNAINALTSAGVEFTASTEQNNGDKLTQTAKLMVAATAQAQADVTYLSVDNLQAINVAQSAERTIKVKALNSSGGIVTNKDISLALSKTYTGIRIKEGSKLTTNAAGEAVFTLEYDATKVSAADQATLQTQGLTLTASYAGNGATVSQSTTLAYFALPVNIARMDLVVDKGALVVDSTTAQTVNATAILKDAQGKPIANRQVTLALDNAALQNGVGFAGVAGGSTVVNTDAAGQATVALTVQPSSKANIDALVGSSIGIGASALQSDGVTTITQSTKVSILSATTLNEVGYLTTSSANSIATTGGSSSITVKAFNKDGTALANKAVSLNLATIPAGLNIKLDATNKTTAADGSATFNLTYIAPAGLSAEQIKALLAGIAATASYTDAAGKIITQNTTVQFTVDQKLIQTMDMVLLDKGAVISALNSPQKVRTLTTLLDTAGKPIANRQFTIALDSAAVHNGASLDGSSTGGQTLIATTDDKGQYTATLTINPSSKAGLDALIASGVGIGASAVQADGSTVITQSVKVNVLSAAVQNEVAYMTAVTSNGIDTSGGSSKITIKAYNSDGTALAGKIIKLDIASKDNDILSVNNGLDIKLQQTTVTTNANGEAVFDLSYTAQQAPTAEQLQALVKGIQLTASVTNSAGKVTTQSLVQQFYINKLAIQTMELTTSSTVIINSNLDSQPVVAIVTLRDSLGNPIANRQATVWIDTETLANGVSFDRDPNASSINVVTDKDGRAIVKLTLKARSQELLNYFVNKGITINANVAQGDGSGVTLKQSRKTTVLSQAAIDGAAGQVAYLTANNDKPIPTTGGDSIITVKAFNSEGKAIAGREVNLVLNNVPTGLSIKVNNTKQITDTNGAASFAVHYDAAAGLSAEQIKALLAGISATASYTDAAGKIISQNATVQFYADQINIARMDLVLDKNSLVLSSVGAETVKATITLKDSAGNAVKNRQVLLAVDALALQNGVTIQGSSSGLLAVTTDGNGQAEVNLTVQPNTADKVSALVTSGIGIGISAVQGDGSAVINQSSKINVLSSATLNEVGYLTVTNANSIATTGGSSSITVKAFNSNGTALANKAVSLNLATIPAGLNIKLDATNKTTAADGSATFNLTYIAPAGLSAEQIKALLAGISATASYTDAAGKIISQNATVQFYADQINIARMDLVLDKNSLVLSSVGAETVKATITLKDSAGNAVKNRQVLLAVDALALQNGVTIQGSSSGLLAVTTDGNGQAEVNLTVQPNTADKVSALVTSGIGIGISAVQGDGSAVINQSSKINVLSSATLNEVGYLTVTNANSIATTGGSSSITVKAFNSNGTALANKAVSLNLATIPAGLNIKLDATNKTTAADGSATFNLTYIAPAGLSAEQIKALLAGIAATASYTDAAGKAVTQSTTVQFYVNQQNIERMDLVTAMAQSPTQNGGALSLRLNDKKSFQTTVTLKDRNGKPVANHQVLLSLGNIAVDNNTLFRLVSFKDVTGGLVAVQTDANGQAQVTLEALVQNQSDLDALMASGIVINASAVQGDGSLTITQTTSVRVVSEAAETVAANAVSYLTAVSSNSLATTTNGSTEITVKAFNAKGEPLAGKGISLALADVPAGLTISLIPTSPMSDITNANGEAKFTVTYTAPPEGNLTPSQIKGLLAGISAIASYSESGKVITQTTKIQFYADSATIAQDAQRLDVAASTGKVLANSDTFTLTTTVIDRSGNPAANKFVTLSLDAASSQNGVSIASVNQLKTDTNGKVTFTINVRGANQQMIDNLVANGISLTSTVVQSNGAEIKQTTKVMAEAPQTLAVSSLVATVSNASIESTGGSSVVAVRAVDINGKPVANQNVNFALGGINATNARVSVDKNAGLTNAQGYVYFTVTIANGELDANLIKDGLAYAFSTINENDGTTLSQVGKISVSVPQGTFNLLPLTPSKTEFLVSGDTITVSSKLVDDTGAPIKSQPVTLVVNKVGTNGGVNVEGGMNAITDVNGNVSFKITLPEKTDPAQINELLTNGLTVKTAVTLPNGNMRYSPDLNLRVNAAVSPFSLSLATNKPTMVVTGDKALITVSARNIIDGSPVRNQKITLSVRKTSSTTGTNVGIIASNDPANNGVTTGQFSNNLPTNIVDTWEAITDESGNAYFSLQIPTAGFDKDALIATGIVVEATATANNRTSTPLQPLVINVADTEGAAERNYSLRLQSSKPQLDAIKGDTATVTATLLDGRGGVVANQYVTLNADNNAINGAIILGPSGLMTDNYGKAVFTVKIDPVARSTNYSTAQFAEDNLNLTARFTMQGAQSIAQALAIDVIEAAAAPTIANITLGNSGLLETSSNGEYYDESVSALVVDQYGKPISNQPVTMTINKLSFGKGAWVYNYNAQPTPTRETAAPYTICPVTDANAPAFMQIGTAFIAPNGSTSNMVTFTTDSNGRFDFKVQYLRRYATWQTVNLVATTTYNGNTVQSSMRYDLNASKPDMDNAAGQPFDRSPYGVGTNCANQD